MTIRPIYYDTETTGVKPDKDRIIELAAYDPVRDKTFVSLINPKMAIPPEATAIHNITNEMVQEAATFDEVGKAFIEFCDGDVVLIAHNNDAFDQIFIHTEFSRNNLQVPSWKFLDTLKWARKYRPDLPRHSLQFLREVYQIPANQAHRALDDVIVLHKVFSYMLDDLSMETALELMSERKMISRMPFGKHQGKAFSEIPKDYLIWLKNSGALDKPENKELLEALLAQSLLHA